VPDAIGCTAVHTEAGEMFLLFVHPAHAGRGVGGALLNAAHDVLRAAGRTEAFLFTEKRNTRARAVYAQRATDRTAQSASQSFTAPLFVSCDWSKRCRPSSP
jgi:GNAT superfamily N-acetyltransferase